jgi:hypothetical protein
MRHLMMVQQLRQREIWSIASFEQLEIAAARTASSQQSLIATHSLGADSMTTAVSSLSLPIFTLY